MRILHIDDDEDLRNVVSRYIRDYWPDAHIDGYDPLERDLPSASFPLRSYDLIVLDYMLGRGDGLEWLKALKQRDDCPKIRASEMKALWAFAIGARGRNSCVVA
jgi:DNA-binding response OmpR family regulator